MNGLQCLTELAARRIAWPVIVLSGHGEVSVAVKAVQLGAIDFLGKPDSAPELDDCLDRAFQHLDVQLSSGRSRKGAEQLMALITPREGEVLECLCQGLSNKQVAFALSISPRTVEMHRANLLRQLKSRTLVEALAVRNLARE